MIRFRKSLAVIAAMILLISFAIPFGIVFFKAEGSIDTTNMDNVAYAVEAAKMYPQQATQTGWGWGNMWSYSQNADGSLKVAVTNCGSVAHCVGIKDSFQLDGMHMRLKFDWSSIPNNYNNRIFYFSFANQAQYSINNNPKPLAIKIDMSAGHLELLNAAVTTRVLNQAAITYTNTDTLDLQVKLNNDGSYTFSCNGIEITADASHITNKAPALTDLSRAMVTFATEANVTTNFNILSVHGGEDVCLEKYYNYSDFKNHTIKDSILFPSSGNLSSWGWPATHTELPYGGTRIIYTSAVPEPYTHGINKAVKFDGMHLKMKFNWTASTPSTDKMFWIVLAPNCQRYSSQDAGISFYFDMASGFMRVHSGGSIVGGGTVNDVGNRIYNNSFNSEKYRKIDFKIEAVGDGSYRLIVNGFEYIITSPVMASATALSGKLNATYLSIAPAGGALSYDLVSFHGGESGCFDKLALNNPEQIPLIETAIDAINAIGIVGTGSEPAIIAAREAFDAILPEYQNNVTNKDKLLEAENIYYHDGLDLDYLAYPPSVSDITAAWGWTGKLEWSYAASGKGITLDFLGNSCWHRHTVNYNRPVSVDGLHVTLDNGSTNRFGFFQIALTNNPMPDIATTRSPFALQLYLEGTNKTNLQYLTSSGVYDLAVNTQASNAMAAAMSGKWDMRMDANEDGSYTLLFAGQTFIIPKARMDEAKASGLNFNKVYYTIGDVNGAQTSKWKFDVVSVHGKEGECYEHVSMNDALTIENAVNSISNIGTVTEDSGDEVFAARTAYDSVAPQYKYLINNYETLTVAEKIYHRLTADTVDLDYMAYECSTDSVGPSHHWSTDMVDWQAASSGNGVTLKFNNTTVHNIGLTAKNQVAFDGIHIEFDKMTFNETGRNFSLIFAPYNQTDHTSPSKLFWLDFWIGSAKSTVTANAPGISGITVIDSKFLNESVVSGRWDVRIDKNTDNSYRLQVGDVEGVIPASFVDAAVEAGLDINASNITFGMRNYSGANAGLTVDVLNIHGGEGHCYAAISEENANIIFNTIDAINVIGNVTANSKALVENARKAYNSVPDEMKGLIYNFDTLTDAESAYHKIAIDVEGAQKVIALINDIDTNITLNSKDKIVVALGAYTDLYPRARQYVSNYDKLSTAKSKYEKLDPNADFETWILALANTEFVSNTGNDMSDSNENNNTDNVDTGENGAWLFIAVLVLILSAGGITLMLRKRAK